MTSENSCRARQIAQPAAAHPGRYYNAAVYAKYIIYPAGVDFVDLSMPRALRISIY